MKQDRRGARSSRACRRRGAAPPHAAHSRTRSGFHCGSAKRSPTWNHRKRTDDSHFGLSTANDSHVREHAPSPTIQQIAVQTQSLGRKRLFQVGRGLRISNRETARGYRGAGPLPAGGKRPGSFLPMSPAASQSPMVPKAVSPAPAATSSSTLRLHTNTIYLLIDGSSGVPPPASSLTPNSRLIDSTSRGTPLSGSPAGTLDATGTNQRPSTPNGFARSCPSPVRSRFVLPAARARASPLSLAPLHVPSRPPYRIRPRRAAGWHPGSLGPSCES